MSKVIWGVNPLLEALEQAPDLIEEIILEKKTLSGKKYRILEKAKALGIPVKFWERDAFSPPKVPPKANTQGVVAYLREFNYAELKEIEANWLSKGEIALVLALDEVQDPQNVGSLLRLSDAFGVHGVIIPKHRACQVTGTVVKVSAGSAFNVPIARVKNLKEALEFFQKRGLWILGLTHRAEKNIFELDLTLPLLIIAGNEEKGIRPSILERCDFLAKIPMVGRVESLNVSQATGIALYEVLRQRILNKSR
ncbi:MAG: 23S rRNA (guanosine(2251)-2'-O)-methyltransferase RlmB [Caldimicrobium thiodismutans]|uniref:23S rRNA (Guanosine(2251)-2'-O)-methyltransferase RlmB n=1 Tax=Caldimicrobium thiodismutans TaxID=1653476 RepID=A0A2N7PK87_9BACT|nr:MAG: 23S rRNA (guanosine(2251)-2'-O)-methyltransferase RlmB [Caldimicrobium thiodismutans]